MLRCRPVPALFTLAPPVRAADRLDAPRIAVISAFDGMKALKASLAT